VIVKRETVVRQLVPASQLLEVRGRGAPGLILTRAVNMFEHYSEKARRVIFFGRYEASQFGSPCIETEHLLLGLLREDKALANRLPNFRLAQARLALFITG
jgi:Clp amino terminal domain, pathogenicity island component